MSVEAFGQIAINGLTLAVVYIVLGLGLALLFSMMGILFFAVGQTYMLGTFAIYFLYTQFGLNFGLSLFLVILLLGVFGFLVEKGLFRPIRGQMLAIFIASLGLAWVIEMVAIIAFGLKDRAVTSPFTGSMNLLGVILTGERLAVVLGGLAAILGLHFFLKLTKFGTALRAFVDDPVAAELQGLSSDFACSLSFVLACVLCGVAGGLVAPLYTISPVMGTSVTLKAFIIIGLGGLGSIPGVLIAGLILGLMDSFIGTMLGTQYTLWLSFAFLTVFLAIRPRGLMGIERTVRV